MKGIKERLAEEIGEESGVNVGARDIEVPNQEFGDYAYPVMRIAGEKDRNPRELAEELAEALKESDIVKKVEVAGPGYLNFYLDRERHAEIVKKQIESEDMGVDQKEGKVIIDFSAPNVAKPMHIGHGRNNALGDALQRILSFVGYKVVSENYIGDWGTQYGKLIYAFKEYGSMEAFEEAPMEHMFELYVKFHEEAENNEELKEKGREWSKKVEEGDEEARKLWKMFRDASIEFHKEEYRRMGIAFDRWTGESTVLEETESIIQEGVEKGIIKEDEDGSLYMEFKDMPDNILKRADGATLYLSRDLGNLSKRNEKGFDYNLYVVASEQDLHFKQVFEAAEKLGINNEGCEHISYGLVKLEEGSMSSRKGRVIRLSEVLDTAVEKAREKIEGSEYEGNPEAVGIGAFKYANLSVSRNKDIQFSWDRALSFEGDSGPYLQYSNTRAGSILEKADVEGEIVGGFEDGEHQLLKEISRFPEVLEDASNSREPAKVANYLSELCEEFNSFYHDYPVIQSGEEDKKRRLKIVELFQRVTEKGLELLGIDTLDEM